MITLFLGNVGSGKTASAVWEVINKPYRKYYTNIKIKAKNAISIKGDMIIKKELQRTVNKKDGTQKPIYDISLNKEFWMNVEKPISIILDETDQYLFARSGMSKTNKIMSQWLSMIRRVLGQGDVNAELILITQLSRKMDVIGREMAHNIKYFLCTYLIQCKKCGATYQENSDMPKKMELCECGGYRFNKHSHVITVYCFADIDAFTGWKEWGMKTYYENYNILDIHKTFDKYDSYQWDDMFEDFY